MAPNKTVAQLNREVGEQVLSDAGRNPQAYPGRYVGIADGKVAVIANDLDDLVRRLDQVQPDPAKTYCVELGVDYSKVYEIWEIG